MLLQKIADWFNAYHEWAVHLMPETHVMLWAGACGLVMIYIAIDNYNQPWMKDDSED